MNKLFMSRVYLAGPIDRVQDRGVQWRRDIASFLHSLNIGVIDPCNKPIHGAIPENDDFVKIRLKLKQESQYDVLHEIMSEIVSTDLRGIDLSDFIILNVDTSVHMCGSYNEQTHAALQRKPVLVHSISGIKDVPDWLYGVCDHREFFEDWESLKDYIYQISIGGVLPSRRWKFFDYRKIYGM